MSWHVLVCYLNKIQVESVNVVSTVISRNTYLSEPHGLGEKRQVYCRHFVSKQLLLWDTNPTYLIIIPRARTGSELIALSSSCTPIPVS